MYISNNTAERIKEIAKSKNISVKDMLESCGLNKNVLSTMVSRGSWLQANNLAKIADYLNCSVDYLLGRQNFSVPPDIEKKNNAIADIVLRLRSDAELLSIVKDISALPPEKLQAVKTLISVIKE